MGGLRADYAAMRDSRFRRKRPGVDGIGSDADAATSSEYDFVKMREYARAMFRDDLIIKRLVLCVIHNVVRTGFRYEPQTGDEGLNRDLWYRWKNWSEERTECDVAGVMTFADMERAAVLADILDGDIFPVGTNEGTIQFYEAHRCQSPNRKLRYSSSIVHGVQMDERRRRQRYWFRKETPGLLRHYNVVGDFEQIDAFDSDGNPNVWHIFDPLRVTQTRGVTAFHPAFDKAGMYEDIDFALLVKEQMAAFLAWEEQTTSEYQGPGTQFGTQTHETRPDGTTQTIEEMAPGTIAKPPKGKTLKMHQTSIASTETMLHLRHTLQMLSLTLGLPLCVATLDASEASFSSQRFVMDQAKLGFITNQQRYESQFHRPAVRWKVRDWMATDPALRAAAQRTGIDIFGHKWHKPRWPYIQPLHDAQADALRLETGLTSLRRVHAERGEDFEDVADESVLDNEYWITRAMQATQRIKAQFPDESKDLHWSTLYHRALPKGMQSFDQIDQLPGPDGSPQPMTTGKANG
jgi:capsid protein